MGDPNAFKDVVSPWQPTTDEIEIALLGKLQEELGELMGIVGRILCQGIEGAEPTTGLPNRAALQHEIADVMAGFTLVMGAYRLNHGEMQTRTLAKVQHLERWHEMIQQRRGTSSLVWAKEQQP